MYRKTWMEIDLDGIEYNIRTLRQYCGKKIIAVLKANAYGTGDREVAESALSENADMIAVSSLDEAEILRHAGYTGKLLILGPTDAEDVTTLIKDGVSCAGYSLAWAKEVVKQDPQGLLVHLKVDTGMNRIGFKDKDELKEAFELLKDAGCVMEGIFTHFYAADTDHAITEAQYARFKEAVEYLDYPFEWIHCDNSEATVWFKDDLSNACRIGIAMYGISESTDTLHKPLAMYSEVAMVKHVSQGETIGYGGTYTAQGDEIIATLPIGYADGFIRANSGRCVYIDGMYAPVVGRICMDQCMVKLEREVEPGTKAEIFGAHISLESMANDLNTIPYEIISLVTPRVTRVYVRHGERNEVNERMVQ